jgi:hypothetical protein
VKTRLSSGLLRRDLSEVLAASIFTVIVLHIVYDGLKIKGFDFSLSQMFIL